MHTVSSFVSCRVFFWEQNFKKKTKREDVVSRIHGFVDLFQPNAQTGSKGNNSQLISVTLLFGYWCRRSGIDSTPKYHQSSIMQTLPPLLTTLMLVQNHWQTTNYPMEHALQRCTSNFQVYIMPLCMACWLSRQTIGLHGPSHYNHKMCSFVPV